MGHVPNIKKRRKGRRKTVGLIIIIILIVGCIIGFAVKRKLIQTAGDKMGKQAVLSVFSVELEKQYIEFEKLFREQQDDIKRLAEELLSQDILDQKHYFIVFDEQWYLGSSSKDFMKFLYSNDTFRSEGNEELVEKLNDNSNLKEILNSIIEKGVIIQIVRYKTGDIWILEFNVDTKFTPFITSNNGATNTFKYCENEECERYGYRKIENNWYLWISPGPDG